jgi:hypothetical protein
MQPDKNYYRWVGNRTWSRKCVFTTGYEANTSDLWCHNIGVMLHKHDERVINDAEAITQTPTNPRLVPRSEYLACDASWPVVGPCATGFCYVYWLHVIWILRLLRFIINVSASCHKSCLDEWWPDDRWFPFHPSPSKLCLYDYRLFTRK